MGFFALRCESRLFRTWIYVQPCLVLVSRCEKNMGLGEALENHVICHREVGRLKMDLRWGEGWCIVCVCMCCGFLLVNAMEKHEEELMIMMMMMMMMIWNWCWCFPPPFLETKLGSWYNLDISTKGGNHCSATRKVGDHRLTLEEHSAVEGFCRFLPSLGVLSLEVLAASSRHFGVQL